MVFQVTDEDGSEVEQSSLLTKLLIGEPAIGDVAEDYSEELFTADLGLRDGSLNGEFLAVGTHAEDGVQAAHSAASGMGLAKSYECARHGRGETAGG